MRRHAASFRVRNLLLFVLLTGSLAPAYSQVVPLPKFNVDIKQTSVSGLSSGGFMAVQFDVAFSSISKGAGVIAGGPYLCAKGDLQTALRNCMNPGSPINLDELIRKTEANARSGAIDPTSNLASHRVWLFSGTRDETVKQPVMTVLEKYYQHFIDNDNGIFHERDTAAGHAMPTDSFGNACSVTKEPFINHCAFDAAGELLKWIYGPLNSPNAERLKGAFIEFDQSQFIANPSSHGMSNSGWVYAPESCQQGAACRLHIVFHGCKQYPDFQYFSGSGMVRFGRTYVDNAGYNRWADTNNIVVLYPQATKGNGNPNGCWDWFAYDDVNYAQKNGRQMAAVKAMADRMASPVLSAPQALSTDGVTEASVSLVWNPVREAAGYNVYRNDSKVTAQPVSDARFIDTGLAPGTAYTHQVRAVDASGREGQASSTLSSRTSGDAPVVPVPTGLSVGKVSASSVDLSWTAVPNVAGYNVFFRSDAGTEQFAKANVDLITAPSFTVGGLKPGVNYRFVVRSQSGAGASSGNSNEVSATTPAATACFTESNFSHVMAGRAHASGVFALANGSNVRMGLNNVFITTTLKQTGPNFYVIDNLTCP